MNKNLLAIVAVALLAGPAVQSVSAGVIYDETVNGELSSTFAATPLGILPVGTSTLLGAIPQVPVEDRGDFFTFVVAPDTQLTHLFFTFDSTGFSSGVGLFFKTGSQAAGPSIGSLNTTASGFTSGSDLFGFGNFVSGPLSSGTYRMDMVAVGADWGLNSYAFDFVVEAPSAVPEPGTLALFGLGLAGLGFARRRRATH
jgi:PEP-CTERM putative exosortase interaction domain